VAKVLRLQGLSFREELDGKAIRFQDSIVYLALIPWEFCNWECQYCHEEQRRKEPGELTLQEMVGIVREGGALGIRTLLLLGGEILLRNTWEITQQVVKEAFDQGLITLIYTNGSQMTEEMAEWLASHNVSLAFKVDSLQPDVYDRLSQRQGSFESTMRAVQIARKTSIGQVVYENGREKLVRLLFTTVGNALNVEEYVSLARFATNHGARWMMEALNHRGDAATHPGLALSLKDHSEAMRLAMLLNPEQQHTFQLPCRLFSCVTIRKKGAVGVCPQDYAFVGNIRELGSLKAACDVIKARVMHDQWRASWNGVCPIKANHFVTE